MKKVIKQIGIFLFIIIIIIIKFLIVPNFFWPEVIVRRKVFAKNSKKVFRIVKKTILKTFLKSLNELICHKRSNKKLTDNITYPFI